MDFSNYMLNKFVMLLVITTIIVGSMYLIPDIDALSKNKDYVILSEKYFFVFGLDDKNNVFVRDGGVLYNSEWHMINMTANVEIEQYDGGGNLGWIIGELDSGEDVWFSWNLIVNNNTIAAAFVYDGETLTEFTYYEAYLKRLFF